MFCFCSCDKHQSAGKIGELVEKIFKYNNSMRICCIMESSGKVISYMTDLPKTLVDSILSKVLSIKLETIATAKELGFDSSKEFTFKTDEHVIFMYDIFPNNFFIAVFEMDEVNSLFFSGTKFVSANEIELLDLRKFLEEGYRY